MIKETLFSTEQYKILTECSQKQDVSDWNQWRKENPDVPVILAEMDFADFHLSEANLAGACFFGCNFNGAELWGINGEGADFTEATLERADLSDAILCDANFTAANLSYVDLSDADLTDTIFCDAILDHSNIVGSSLKRSNLSNSRFHFAYLYNVNMDEVTLNGIDKANWNIKDVTCSFIYTNKNRHERFPHERTFEEGEFESLYGEASSFRIDLPNKGEPVDIIAFTKSVETLRGTHPQFGITIESITTIPYGSIKCTVSLEKHINRAKEWLETTYKNTLKEIMQSGEKMKTEIAINEAFRSTISDRLENC